MASHAANQIYDVFVFSNAGVLTLVTGPAWATPTAGSCTRGTGAGTTELTRLLGFHVNNVQITGRNGATTYTIGANLATYLGSIFMDGSNGQLTCHREWGQSRKWGIWNAYNRQPLYLKAGDPTASWPYQTNTIRASRNQATNSLTVFQGLAEELYHLAFVQKISTAVAAVLENGSNGIGWNSTTAISGMRGWVGHGTTGGANPTEAQGHAQYLAVPALGINVVTALETSPAAGGTVTWHGGEDDMVLSVRWRG